ncbi:hypothetical protein IV203_017205 [Nitzschia inconspicua]|uniref:Uncharacterized protein n=1 Tax=Nitzschia inconspicua TaxID=303405 RepID=A0A9K3KRI3_9STRA|nr:hypothetical protein IV203_017205 [Nitzschia inconspicua]
MRTTPPPPTYGSCFSCSEDSGEEAASHDKEFSVPSSLSSLSMTKFLADREKHPIEAVMETRSWMDDDGNSLGDMTDDDEFRKELERLNLSEEQVARDIRAAMALFQEATAKKELSKRETSLIRMSYLDMVENGSTRDSSKSTCPSDEAYASDPETAALDTREPQTVAQQRNESDYQRTIDSTENFEIYEDPTAELWTLDGHESLKTANSRKTVSENHSNDPEGLNDTRCFSPQVQQKSDAISDWNEASRDDVESGSSRDIFEEASFWDGGLWKSPFIEQITKKESKPTENVPNEDSSHMPKEEFFDEYEDSNHTRALSKSKKYGVLEKLFLPDLRTPTEDGTDDVPNQTEEISQEAGDQIISSFQDNFELSYWEARQESYEMREIHFSRPPLTRSQPNRDSDPALSKLPFGSDPAQHPKSQGWCRFFWTLTIIIAHVVLVVLGIVLFTQYLLSGGSASFPAPSNNFCSSAELIVETPKDEIIGTTYGVTKSSSLCGQEMAGAWYRLVGTGQQIVVTVEDENFVSSEILVMSGPCSQLVCEGDLSKQTKLSRSPRTTSTSVLWPSKAGELYHILVHGQQQGDFSLSLQETPQSNSDCGRAVSVLLPPQNQDFVIKSRTISSPSPHPCDFFGFSGAGSWFAIPGNGKYITATLCNSTLSNQNMRLELLNGSCDASGCSNDPMMEAEDTRSIGWLSNQDEKNYLFVWNSEDEETEFSLCITQDEVGETCDSSISISSFPNTSGRIEVSGALTAFYADDSNAESPIYVGCIGNSEPRSLSWYQVEGDGGSLTVSTCDSNSGNLTAVFDVFTGSDCADLQCVQGGTSASCGASGQQFLSWSTVKGQLYWIAVYGDDPAASGSFTLDITHLPRLADDVERKLDFQENHPNSMYTLSYALAGSACALFAKYAWRWRRLKRKY